ncbi:hypothetical protein PRIPAC_80261 [Pristionchus pacificus]|nr:hypothetical protein PRIPAC_80261 [Pristionchus pacificus]|eukprot:PDM65419.1 hypothetical protein PRIPAC_52361 [Pristionchus pacificus]
MRDSLFVVLVAFIAGAHAAPRPVFTTTANPALFVRQRECAREGTLRVFRFSEASPIFCECVPGFEGRYCEKRICKNGKVRIIAQSDDLPYPPDYRIHSSVEELDNPDSWYPDLLTTTDCYCNPGFDGPTCEERIDRTAVTWIKVLAILEPIVFFIIFLIPCCCALHMAKEFCKPLLQHDRYSMMFYDVTQAYRPRPENLCTGGKTCPYEYKKTAPPPYVYSPLTTTLVDGLKPSTAHIVSRPTVPKCTVLQPTVSQPTVSPISELRQPVYTQAKCFPHV